MSIVCATERSRELIKRIVLICLLMGAVKCLQDDEWNSMNDSYSFMSPKIEEAKISEPQNLACPVVSTYMIYVNWDPPLDGTPKYYRVEWTSSDGDTEIPTPTSQTEYNMTDLLPCTHYTISVRSSDGTSESDPAEVTCETTPPSVSPPPTDVQITSLASDKATVIWTAPIPWCIIMYSITWEYESLWGEGQATGDGEGYTNSEETSYIIHGLTPYSNFTACVSAALSNADFGQPSCASGITIQDSPGPPTVVGVTTDKGLAVVTWKPPENQNGVIENYTLTWKTAESEEDCRVFGNVLSYNLWLLLCETYYFSVSAKTAAEDWGPPSNEFEATILNYLPADNVVCSSNSDGSVTVSWTTASSKCLVSGFHAEYNWTSLWSEDADSKSLDLGPDDMELNVREILPYSRAYFCVSVDDKLDNGGCCTINTAQEAPGPPTVVGVSQHEGLAVVTWKPPEIQNGVIENYNLTWKMTESEENSTVVGNVLSYNLTLPLCETYYFSVSAKTAAEDWGPLSNQFQATILNYIPADNVICSSNPDGSVTVSWTTASSKCPVSGFHAEYNWTSLWSEDEDSKSLDLGPDDMEFKVREALPYSRIYSCVSVGDKLDNGVCCTINTAQEVPGRPENMTHGNIAESEVNVTWSEPTDINGILGSWILSLNIEDEEVFNVILPPETRSYEVVDLLRDTDYNVTLQASTEAGFGDAAFCIISTPALVDDELNLAAIIGGTVGVLLGLVVIVGAVFFGRKWKARKSERKHNEIRAERQMTHTPERNINNASNKELVNGTKPFSNCNENQSRVSSTSYDNQNFKMPSSDTTDDRGYKKPSTNAHEKQKIKRLMSENINYQYIKRFSLTINETRNFRRPVEDIDEIKDVRRPSVDTNESRNFRSRLEEIYKAKKPSTEGKKLKDFRNILTKGNEKFQQAFNRHQ